MLKIIKILLIVLGAIAAILLFFLPGKEVPFNEAVENGAMGFMFIIAYILLGIAILFSLFYSLSKLVSNPASLKKALFVLVGLVLVGIISYVMSDGADGTVEALANKNNIVTTESTVKNIGAGLNVFFILTFIAVGSMVWGGIKKMTNK